MAQYGIAAFICSVIGVLPLILSGRFVASLITVVVSDILLSFCFYLGLPAWVGPLGGSFGVFIFLLFIASAIIDHVIDDFEHLHLSALFPVIGLMLYFGSCTVGANMFRSDDYVRLAGSMPEREWTQDVQPKSEKHLVMVPHENAYVRARTAVTSLGNVGSQFQIDEGQVTTQKIHHEVWYAIPLDYATYGAWRSTDGVPGYLKISGEDPYRDPQHVILPTGKKLKYTPGAYFEYNLERHIRTHGYMNAGLTDYSFEEDEDSNVWWVVTMYQPTISWWGEKVIGVLVVDPATGDIKQYDIDKVPAWIDRVIPKEFALNYLASWGYYLNGYWNTYSGVGASGANMLKPGRSRIIYGAEDDIDFVTDMTSVNSKDDSIVGVVYQDTRTGEARFYRTNGGATDEHLLENIANNQDVKMKHLHGCEPQLYNVYGTMASVIPLLNDSHAFSGVAIIDIKNTQIVGVGRDQEEAYRVYQRAASLVGKQIAIEKNRDLKTLRGLVLRINQIQTTTGEVFYLYLADYPHIFTGGFELSPKLPLTHPGDTVLIGYIASNEKVETIETFDNLSFEVQSSTGEDAIHDQVEHGKKADTLAQDASEMQARVKNMKPEELQKLLHQKTQ